MKIRKIFRALVSLACLFVVLVEPLGLATVKGVFGDIPPPSLAGKIQVSATVTPGQSVIFDMSWTQKPTDFRTTSEVLLVIDSMSGESGVAAKRYPTGDACSYNDPDDPGKGLYKFFASPVAVKDLPDMSFSVPKVAITHAFQSSFSGYTKIPVSFMLLFCGNAIGNGVPAYTTPMVASEHSNTITLDLTENTEGTNIGSEFDDGNIDKFIECQIKIFDASPPDGLSDSQKEQYKKNFTEFMQSFKNSANSQGRVLIKKLMDWNFTGDPLGFTNGSEIEGSYPTKDELAQLRNTYFNNAGSINLNDINDIVGKLDAESVQRLKEMDSLAGNISFRKNVTLALHWFGIIGGAVAGGLIGGGLSGGTGIVVGAMAGAAFFNVVFQKTSDTENEAVADSNDVKIAELAKEINMIQYKAMFALVAGVRSSLKYYKETGECNADQIATVVNTNAIFDRINAANLEATKLTNIKSANETLRDAAGGECGVISVNTVFDWAFCNMVYRIKTLADWAQTKAEEMFYKITGINTK